MIWSPWLMVRVLGEKVSVPPAPTNTLVVAAKPASVQVKIIALTPALANRVNVFIAFMFFFVVSLYCFMVCQSAGSKLRQPTASRASGPFPPVYPISNEPLHLVGGTKGQHAARNVFQDRHWTSDCPSLSRVQILAPPFSSSFLSKGHPSLQS